MILYINSCVRRNSRTDKIARAVLNNLGGEYTELFLPDENLQPLSEELLEKRTKLIENNDYSDKLFDYAKQFAKADIIVISAPYWDCSFPAILKLYIENIYVTGIITEFTPNGLPHGLCKAKELIYVTTAGGPYVADYSFGYIKTLAEQFMGIPKTTLVKAEMLDIEGFDAEKIVNDTISNI
ncbi:MAG: NAD(P)H-dependent oxidoreductase [Ruminococcus sp.]|nr:NAD(P)H-dependent oxidoreductase [Ruminococcus sp.]